MHKISLIYHHKKEGFWNQEQKKRKTPVGANEKDGTGKPRQLDCRCGRICVVVREVQTRLPGFAPWHTGMSGRRIFCNIRMPTAWALSAGAGLTGDWKRVIPPKKTLTPYIGFVRCAFQFRRSDGHCNAVFVCGLQTCFIVPPFGVGESTSIRLIKNYFITKP